MSRLTEAGDIYFFCDWCSEIRLSRRHTVILTSRGAEITRDECSHCGVVQEIESVGKDCIETYRIRDGEYKKDSNKT